MIIDDRVADLAEKHLDNAKRIKGAKLAIIGEDNTFFRAIRNEAKKTGIEIVDFQDVDLPMLVNSSDADRYVLSECNDIDCVVTSGLSCVAAAALELLKTYQISGKHIVIVGRGHAAKGLAKSLLSENATVTVCHSKTKYLNHILQEADIVVIAAPIKERYTPYFTNVVIDISGSLEKREAEISTYCDYTRHIGKLTVAILLERAALWRKKQMV